MYVRVLSFVCRSDVDTEHIQNAYREISENARDQDGFMGSSLFMGDDMCRGMALIYWRDHQAAAEAGSKLVSLIGERIHSLLTQPPEIHGYNLVENNFDFDQAGR